MIENGSFLACERLGIRFTHSGSCSMYLGWDRGGSGAQEHLPCEYPSRKGQFHNHESFTRQLPIIKGF